MKISAQISILIYFPPLCFFFFPTHPCCFPSYPSNQTTGLLTKKQTSPQKSIRFADLKEVHLNDAQDPVLGRLRTQLGIMKWAKQKPLIFGWSEFLTSKAGEMRFFLFFKIEKTSPLFSGEEQIGEWLNFWCVFFFVDGIHWRWQSDPAFFFGSYKDWK